MSDKIMVYYEVSGQGEVELEPSEVVGMTDEEIRSYLYEGAEMDVTEQSGYSIDLRDSSDAIAQYRRENPKGS